MVAKFLDDNRRTEIRDLKIRRRRRRRQRRRRDSDGDGDGNGNAAKTIGLISKTTILHMHHAFLYISLPSLHDYNVKMPNYTIHRGRTQAMMKFPLSFWTWMWFLGIQILERSPTFDKFNDLIVIAINIETFSLPSPSSDLKVPIKQRRRLQ